MFVLLTYLHSTFIIFYFLVTYYDTYYPPIRILAVIIENKQELLSFCCFCKKVLFFAHPILTFIYVTYSFSMTNVKIYTLRFAWPNSYTIFWMFVLPNHRSNIVIETNTVIMYLRHYAIISLACRTAYKMHNVGCLQLIKFNARYFHINLFSTEPVRRNRTLYQSISVIMHGPT